jgi:hypothetical protein
MAGGSPKSSVPVAMRSASMTGSPSRAAAASRSSVAPGRARQAASSCRTVSSSSESGQPPVPEQVDDFLKLRHRRDLFHAVARQDQLALLPVDMAEACLGGDDSFEARLIGCDCVHLF